MVLGTYRSNDQASNLIHKILNVPILKIKWIVNIKYGHLRSIDFDFIEPLIHMVVQADQWMTPQGHTKFLGAKELVQILLH